MGRESVALRFAFVRHAMSVDNQAWRLGQPWPALADAPLCEAGRETLPGLAEEIAPWRPEVVICSPLSRCIETAKAIAEAAGARMEVDYDLREVVHNEGDVPLSREQLAIRYPGIAVFRSEASERGNDTLTARGQRVLSELRRRPEQRVCVVGHRGWLLANAGMDLENGECICLEAITAPPNPEGANVMTVRRIPRLW